MMHKQSMGASGILTNQQMANSALNQLNSAFSSGLATAAGVGGSPFYNAVTDTFSASQVPRESLIDRAKAAMKGKKK